MAFKLTGTALRPTTPRSVGTTKIKVGFSEPAATSSSSSSSSAQTAASDEDVLSTYIDEMYARYAPEELTYDEKSEEELRDSVAEWLRPGYDQAIANRQSQTLTNRAALDADAAARGIGSSTYVTDVKSRQLSDEASDIASLEADYGSTLAKYVSEEESEQNDQMLEVESYNAEQRQAAYDMAYAAAVKLFEYYKKSGGGSGKKSGSSVATTSSSNIASFLNQLTKEERAEVYGATTQQGAEYRAEILASVGYQGYLNLQNQYPSIP